MPRRNQRLRVEQRLHLMESVVGNAAAAVLIAEADPAEPSDPRIVFVNDAYTRLTGYSSDEVVGRTHQVLNGSETDRYPDRHHPHGPGDLEAGPPGISHPPEGRVGVLGRVEHRPHRGQDRAVFALGHHPAGHFGAKGGGGGAAGERGAFPRSDRGHPADRVDGPAGRLRWITSTSAGSTIPA